MLNPQGYVIHPAPLGKTDTGGQTIYVLQLAKALAKRNIKVDIVTRQFENLPGEEEVFENVKIVRIPCGTNQFVPKEKLYELMPEMVENLVKHIEKKGKQYDIIHSHYWDGGYAGYLLSKMLDIPHVHTPHSLGKLKKLEMQVEKVPPTKLKPMYRYHVRIAIEQKIMTKAHAVVVICETSRIQILEHYIVDFEKIHVIYPGIDTQNFNTKKNNVDKRLNLLQNSVLTVSRLVPAKGIDRLIEALSLIKNKIDFHLYIGAELGESKSQEELETRENLQTLIKRYKMTKMVTFIGHVPHDSVLPAYYRHASVFVLASRYEPFGLTTLEAMACGAPPIVSHVAGSKEVIVDGLNGFIVDSGNRKALADTIHKLLKDSKLQTKIAQNAAFTVQEHYSWDKIVEKFIQLYTKLV